MKAEGDPIGFAKLQSAVDEFARAMKERLLQKMKGGFTGWDDPAAVPDFELIARLHDDVLNKSPVNKAVDIANRAMFLWWRAQHLREESHL